MKGLLSVLARRLADPRVILPLLLVFVLVNTAPGVINNPIWNDEFRTWRDGIEKPLSLVLTWKHNADHSPLGHLSARAGAALFGVENAWALRLGNYVCGLLCIPALYWMGRTLVSNAVGLIAAAFFAVDPNCMLQITQARMYGFLLLAGTVAFTLAGSILIRTERPWTRILFCGIAIAVGIWAHSQIYAIVISILLVAIGVFKWNRRAALALLAAVAIGGVLGAQGIAKIVSRHDAEKIENEQHMPAGEQLKEAIEKLGGQEWITYVLFISAAGGAVVFHQRKQTALGALVVLVVAVAIINLAIAAMYRPVAHARYLTILQPAMWLAMGVFLVAICQSKHRFTLGIASVVLTLYLCGYELDRMYKSTSASTRSFEFAQAARLVKGTMKPDDRVIFVPRVPYAMFARYYGLYVDGAIDGALAERNSVRKQRDLFREADLGKGTVWMIGFVTPPKDQDRSKDAMAHLHPSDDPVKVAERVLGARGIDTAGISRVKGVKETKRMMLLKIDEKGVEQIKAPAQLEGEREPPAE